MWCIDMCKKLGGYKRVDKCVRGGGVCMYVVIVIWRGV